MTFIIGKEEIITTLDAFCDFSKMKSSQTLILFLSMNNIVSGLNTGINHAVAKAEASGRKEFLSQTLKNERGPESRNSAFHSQLQAP